eukprot:3394999-Alexandrium_andersonii.AAC.1
MRFEAIRLRGWSLQPEHDLCPRPRGDSRQHEFAAVRPRHARVRGCVCVLRTGRPVQNCAFSNKGIEGDRSAPKCEAGALGGVPVAFGKGDFALGS